MLKKFRPEDIFAPRSPIDFIGFVAVGILIGITSSGNLWGALFLTIFFGIWYRRDRLRRESLSLGIATKKLPPDGARGLIILLSPYSSRQNAITQDELNSHIQKILTQAIESLTIEDFKAINLLNSNLEPQIKAIEYHYKDKQSLQEVWLVGSKGSEQTAEIFQKYLQFMYSQNIRVHFDPESFFADAWDYAGFTRITESIFKKATIRPKHILVDVTGGTKMMSVALAMACIPPKRKMQYIDSERDWQGNPLAAGDKKPVVIDFDPILYKDNN